ncbi:TetR/AcrR family transcriptional regulator [Nocardia inohanensis]|uniref:TetR/AcrR family transcriptional regulator n=1 Tax=Nocardia inohanensis TaxID=209246 RepID=UPI0008367996|nr:TetR/AcrR family transcriptional regulator [Nocardia inohanensis]
MARPAGRRTEILETFIRHVADQGYEKTNLGDIAGELGMSKGTIVHHFGTKAQMLRELEENYMTRQLDAVRRMWEQLETPQERIASIFYASTILQVTDRAATIASQREVVQLSDDPAMQEVRKLRAELQRMTMEELQRGIDAGVFRPVDVEVVALQLWGSMQWMWVWFRPEGQRTPEEIAATFADVFLGGLLVDRFPLATLTDPKGRIVEVVRAAYAA